MTSILPPGNRLLAALPPPILDALRPQLEPVTLQAGQVLVVSGQPVNRFYFPQTAVCSLIVRLPERAVEISTVGSEGLVGLALAWGDARTPWEIVMQVPGEAVCMRTAPFQAALDTTPALRLLLVRYAHARFVQLAQLAACNQVHSAEQRTARWLSLVADQAARATLPITQDRLAGLLGLRRATVNGVCGALADGGLIERRRGQIAIVDRAGLTERACVCYAVIRAQYALLQTGVR